jgi:hypothetical protein
VDGRHAGGVVDLPEAGDVDLVAVLDAVVVGVGVVGSRSKETVHVVFASGIPACSQASGCRLRRSRR